MSWGFQSSYGKHYHDEDRHDKYKQKEAERRTKGIEEEFEEVVVEKTVYDWNHQGRSATVKEIRVKKRVAPPPPVWSSVKDGSSASCKDSSNLSNRGRAKSPTVVEYNHGNGNFTSYNENISVKEEDEVIEGGKRKWTDNSILLRNPLFGSPPSKRLKFVNDDNETISRKVHLTSLVKSDNTIKKLENTATSVKSDEGSSSSDEFIKYSHVPLPPLSAMMTTTVSVSSVECTNLATKIRQQTNQGKILTKDNVTENTHLHCDIKPGYSANNLSSNPNLLPEVGVYSPTSDVRLNKEVCHVVRSEKINLTQTHSRITLSERNDVAVAPIKEVVSQDNGERPTPMIAKPILTNNPETELKVSNMILNDGNTMSEDAGNTSFSSDFSVSTISDIDMLPIDDDVEILFQGTDSPLFSNLNFNVYLNGSSNIVTIKSEPNNHICDGDLKQNHNVMDLNRNEDITSNQKEPPHLVPEECFSIQPSNVFHVTGNECNNDNPITTETNEFKCPENNLSPNSFLNGKVVPTSEKSRRIAALIEDLGMAEKARNVVFDILKSSQSIYSDSNQYKFPFNSIMPLEVAVLRENPSC